MVFGQGAPFYSFSTSAGQADAVNIQCVQLRCLFGRASSQGHFSNLKMGFYFISGLLRLLLSILLSIINTKVINITFGVTTFL